MATKKKTDQDLQLDKDQLKASIVRHLRSTLGTSEQKASPEAWWKATAAAVNEQVYERLTRTQQTHFKKDTRAIHYLSAEFLMGRLTSNNLHNLSLYKICEEALGELGLELTDLCEQEPDMALGNGGLGRLAACFIDSLATLNYPAVGYGIHYEHGLFRQEIQDGRQIERPDSWREYGNPWEICRPESVQEIPLYGYVETVFGDKGGLKKVWHAGRKIKGVPWDIPVVGFGGHTVNILRLWESRASEFFDWDVFNAGGYIDSQAEKAQAETISKVLYPNDETDAGKELRLIQQYFFCACSIKDIMRRYKRVHGADFRNFAAQIAIQLNDTHPTVAIPELMRVLVDEEDLHWDAAWAICYQVFSYTNHTLLPEALEKWSVSLFEKVLPRHLEIIYEINARFLNELVEPKWPGNDAIKAKLSIIEEGDVRKVRMGNLCVIGSSKVNGVAEIHSKLVKEDLFPEYAELWPEKMCNVTNGVTPRRWLLACNPELSALYNEVVGKEWPLQLDKLRSVTKFADDKAFQQQFMTIKRHNKEKLVKVIKAETGIDVSAEAIFDVQIKRLHEYKRQQLNLIHIMALYRRLLANPDYDMHPRVFIFGSKAAPGYKLAKDIIYAINKLAERVNNDARIQGKLKVVFMPNYRVSLAEKLIPAADVSEQISTAGYEASGTGNMKMALNGAITIGTLDGANIEIAEEAGAENCAIFGLNVDEVKSLKARGYNPYDFYYANSELKAVLDWFDTDYFTPGRPGELASIKRSLLEGGDPYLTLADFASYSEAHKLIDTWYRDPALWAKKAIINSATMGKFNSDRSIQDYVDRIWKLKSCNVG
ncbi:MULTISPECIES: glycogen/starch/alpha-glucan phosphorylase [Aeromonas]|uniref:Alpha-1,4 glucan phosphorylase n=1 Tax=Aeromonas rivipollensis TaxID=948519 RepID=A0AAW9Y8Q2_9GAMM|nr:MULTISPECIES: glycogen/starch/alpha-glucan phosphorylase [Aeromonas]QIY86495.1 glycogen/starch/alpha-glucan phosphorylase [Aeromonas hydrophila]MBS4699706.1 glycogen/starch/alpha-glucan phosphorylase [Aeromonas media]MCE9944283.1 glycogen/starch/alpha-glucan phosphorylase [Aeromonas rivipollensis]MDM5059659.1 glycogen/starch/alpha-glucan phosphorylase [Aeromonas rivipollensis]NEX73930.1 glycogen/starch/alpha-glucan phosphorylase [Aeromonas rivipollensis]